MKLINNEREVSISFSRKRHRHKDKAKIVKMMRGEQIKNFVVKMPMMKAIVKMDIL